MRNIVAIFLLLALALLGVSGAVPAQGQCVMPRKMPAMNVSCVKGCCPDMACCRKQSHEQSKPAPLQAPQRDATMMAAILPRIFSLLYELPPRKREFVIRDEAGPHSLPPLSASCIWLI